MESRRAFCAQACRVAVGASLWSSVVKADGELPTVRGDSSGTVVRVTLTGTPLDRPDSYARVISNAGAFLVTRRAGPAWQVFSAICSHESCLITEGDAEMFVCPCHGSTFDHRGAVLVGPAERPLYTCDSSVVDNVLIIQVP